ncbi:MAG: indole-3-glycerol phosphate synthase TrpC [bacterium]|nr:indole-3-glycerol phosphate synthase TrpC [bacterium]
MTTILQQIAESKRHEIAILKSKYKLSDFESMFFFNVETRSLSAALKQSDFGIIAEFKRKSPSAGDIRPLADPIDIVSAYQSAGATAISCLTDSHYFGGSMRDLEIIREYTQLPVLRKDFILDEIQLFEAKAHGADAVLLISELLEPEHAKQLTIIAQSLGMEVLMEAHDRKHLEKINDLVDVIGINNRDLHAQKTNIETSLQLFDYLPKNRVCITESGIKSVNDLERLQSVGYHGALIGESLMKSENPESIISKSPVTCS